MKKMPKFFDLLTPSMMSRWSKYKPDRPKTVRFMFMALDLLSLDVKSWKNNKNKKTRFLRFLTTYPEWTEHVHKIKIVYSCTTFHELSEYMSNVHVAWNKKIVLFSANAFLTPYGRPEHPKSLKIARSQIIFDALSESMRIVGVAIKMAESIKIRQTHRQTDRQTDKHLGIIS